jgi:biopolymer transport protein ExbB/TolQ
VIVKYLLKVAMLGSAWVMYLLLMLSVASIGVMIERWAFFRKRGRGGDELCDALLDLLDNGDRDAAEGLLARHPSVEAEVLLAAFRWIHGGPEAFQLAMEGEMSKRRRDLEAGMTLLGTLGNNAPFVGLLGTVIGVIVAFADLASGSSKVNMDKVMGGIAEALIATAVGLFVAIPAVVAFNFFQKKITDIEDNVGSIGKRVSALLAAEDRYPQEPAQSEGADGGGDYAEPEPTPLVPDVADVKRLDKHEKHEDRSSPVMAPEAGAEE